jgi:signal transduction histidine kinase
MDLHVEPMSVREVVEESVAVGGTQAQGTGVKLALEFSDSVPEAILGDAGRLRQVLANLVGNVVKFTDRGQVMARVQYFAGELRVAMDDTGIGIATRSLP